MKHIAAREAIALLTFMTRVLCAVGLLALAFTTVNVTRFATSRDVPWPIALLLDPMIGTTLAGVLYVDARLASWNLRPPAWSTTLRWGAGCTAALMNTWDSLWPDRRIGWPSQADPAAVLLHLTPALLLIALTETIAAYRRTITHLVNQAVSTGLAEHPLSSPDPPRSLGRISDPSTIGPAPTDGSPQPARPEGTPDTDVWLHAIALDATARATTGKPVSIWRLRTDLHVGPQRARQIHDQLLARHPDLPNPVS